MSVSGWEQLLFVVVVTAIAAPLLGRYLAATLSTLLLYAILRLQGVLPGNPTHAPGMSPLLSFNTAISFITGTNWQAYEGESQASYLGTQSGWWSRSSPRPASGWRWPWPSFAASRERPGPSATSGGI
jgi:hypothetical protein